MYRTFLRCSAFFRGPFIDCPSFFLVLYSCVTLLLLFYSKYVQLIARVCFFVLAGLHLVGRFDCLLWRRSRPSKLLYFYFSPCERLVQAFPFFRTCAQAWVWVVLFFFLMECISPSLFHFVQNMSDAGNTGRCASDVCGVKQKYGLSFLLQRPKCAARLPE